EKMNCEVRTVRNAITSFNKKGKTPIRKFSEKKWTNDNVTEPSCSLWMNSIERIFSRIQVEV
ncbi:MAG: hypothetical protein MPEBLZ_04576, partial [Candidatus Methanoperedens nitroreducens]